MTAAAPPLALGAALTAALALAACGGGRDPRAEPEPRAPSAREPRSDSAIADEVAAPVPPLAALDAARLDALAAVAPAGLDLVARDRADRSIVVVLRGEAPPRRAVVTIGPCVGCRAMTAAAWQDVIPDLRALMPGAIEDDPATAFTLARVAVDGRPCIATWELGAVRYGDELEATHGARVYCNDGVSELTVRVDDEAVARAATPDDALAGADRGGLEAAARDLAAAYLAALR